MTITVDARFQALRVVGCYSVSKDK